MRVIVQGLSVGSGQKIIAQGYSAGEAPVVTGRVATFTASEGRMTFTVRED